MTTSHMATVFAWALTLTTGIIGHSLAAAEDMHPLPSIISDIERHIAELTINTEKISDRIKILHEVPDSKDPLIQEVRNLDIRGWEIHQEQWNLQLDQLRLTEGAVAEGS